MTSLNPVMKIGNQITESIHTHLDVTREFANELAVSLARVGARPRPRAAHGRVPARAVRRPAPARVHRGRARLRSAAALRRRADDRARRHRAGAGARRARGAAARALHGDGARHPRPRRRRRPHRRRDRDVRGPGRREGADARRCSTTCACPTPRRCCARSRRSRNRATPASPRSPGARPTWSPLPPAAGSPIAARTCRTGAARSSRRCLDGPAPGHQFRCWFPVGTPEGAAALERNRAPRPRHDVATGKPRLMAAPDGRHRHRAPPGAATTRCCASRTSSWSSPPGAAR